MAGKQDEGGGVLRETFSPADQISASSGDSHISDPYSPQSKQRRQHLIKELNAGWSEDSERALSRIAAQYGQER